MGPIFTNCITPRVCMHAHVRACGMFLLANDAMMSHFLLLVYESLSSMTECIVCKQSLTVELRMKESVLQTSCR